jgi:hypothetical protein
MKSPTNDLSFVYCMLTRLYQTNRNANSVGTRFPTNPKTKTSGRKLNKLPKNQQCILRKVFSTCWKIPSFVFLCTYFTCAGETFLRGIPAFCFGKFTPHKKKTNVTHTKDFCEKNPLKLRELQWIFLGKSPYFEL